MLGHESAEVTGRHYIRDEQITEESYRDPLVREPGEVVTDFLSRLPKSPHKSPHPEEWEILSGGAGQR